MIKVRNPKRAPGKVLSKTDTAKVLAAVNALDASAADLTFDELRATLASGKRKVSDGELHQLLIDAGFEVSQ